MIENITLDLSKTECLKTNEVYHFSIHLCKDELNGRKVLFTNGLHQIDQTKNAGKTTFVYPNIELYFLLPTYWDFQKNDQMWPLEMLNRIATVLYKNETWFSPGDTIPSSRTKPPYPINDQFLQNYFILSEPIEANSILERIQTGIQFLSIIPIFNQEFHYKNGHSAFELLEKLKEKGHTELLDQFRLPVAKKRFFGLF